MPADSPSSDVADVLTNQSADMRAQGYSHCACFALISAHYWKLFKLYVITGAVLHAYRISDGNVRDDALMPTGRNADHRKRQYVAAMPMRVVQLTITWQPDMVVSPVGRHAGRSTGEVN